MSLRILFADDSMTAQNMGKKILTDAGYDVVAVSNGAAAVKKIAEQKPDIIILDIYMPGYSGLEVCDKVRASHETLRTPVLLTVGKMEPYKPEDANRVRADGVIIKPFEASDLLAVIKKLEERVVPKLPVGEETIVLERPPEFAEAVPPAEETHPEMRVENVQATVDVPDNMATTAAFSDLLAMEPGHSLEPLPVPNYAPPAQPAAFEVSGPADAETEFNGEQVVKHEELHPAPVEQAAEQELRRSPASTIPDTEPIPAYEEPQTAVEEVHVQSEPEKPVIAEPAELPTSHVTGTTDTAAFIDPGLAIKAGTFDPFSARIEAHVQQIEAIVAASEARHIEPEVTAPVADQSPHHSPSAVEAAASYEVDFDARVAQAMSVYDQPIAENRELEAPTNGLGAAPAPDTHKIDSFEYSPPVNAPVAEPVAEIVAQPFTEHAEKPEFTNGSSHPEDAPIDAGPMLMTTEATQVIPVYIDPPEHSQPAAPTAPQHEIAQATTPAIEEKVAAQIEAELPAVAAAAASANSSGMDTMMITGVVDRILDRLKPQLIEEISKELKSKKK